MVDWAMHGPFSWTGLLWGLWSVVWVVRAACPDNAIQKAMMCTQDLGLGVTPTPHNAFVQTGQVELAVKACREHKLQDAVDCLQDIMEVCGGNSDQEHFLRNMVDIGKVRDYVTFFCSHLHEYEQHAPCIKREHTMLTRCTHQQRQNMQTKVKASSNMDFLMASTCKYFSTAEFCFEKVLAKSCSAAAADMVDRLFTAFKPPLCYTVDPPRHHGLEGDLDWDDTSGVARSRSAEVTLLVVVLSLVWIGLMY